MIFQSTVDKSVLQSIFSEDLIFSGVPEMRCVGGTVWDALRKLNVR